MEQGTSRSAKVFSREEALQWKMIVTKVGDSYYSAARKNHQLIPIDTGGYTTFIDLTGTGYLRVIKTFVKKEMTSQFGSKVAEAQFDYTEHLMLGMSSVTYYGVFE